MTHDTQRDFWDWVRFEGHGDVGYYLGARFVRFLLRTNRVDDLVGYDMDRVKEGFRSFLDLPL